MECNPPYRHVRQHDRSVGNRLDRLRGQRRQRGRPRALIQGLHTCVSCLEGSLMRCKVLLIRTAQWGRVPSSQDQGRNRSNGEDRSHEDETDERDDHPLGKGQTAGSCWFHGTAQSGGKWRDADKPHSQQNHSNSRKETNQGESQLTHQGILQPRLTSYGL